MTKAIDGWNLEQMFDPATRPKIYNQPTGLKTKIGCNSFVYKITNTQNSKKYIGYHKEGSQLYNTSTTNKEFKEVLASDQIGILDLEIVHWGSVEECKQREFELLTSANAKSNPQYYNKHNGHPGLRNLDITLVQEIMKEVDLIRKKKLIPKDKTTWYYVDKNSVEQISVKDLWDIPRYQIRHKQIDTENLDKIVDRIKNGIGDYDMPVLFRNITLKGVFYPLILISGNHTRTAYYKTRDKNYGHTENKLLDCVVIDDDVHSQLQETEVHMLGNDLNADFNVGRAFCTKDAIDECMEHYKKGHSWKTNAMRKRFQVLGLTSGQADGVFKKVEDLIQKQELERSGYMIYDYENTHSNLLEKKVEDLTDDTTFSLACSSGAPTLDRWMDKYIDEQIIRSEGGKPMQTKINVVVFHTSFRNRDKWDSLFERLTRPQHLSGLYKQLIGSVYKLPKFSYTEMKMSTKKIG